MNLASFLPTAYVLPISNIQDATDQKREMPNARVPSRIDAHLIGGATPFSLHTASSSFSIDAQDVTDEFIICDRLRLNQVLLNLLSNAMKYTKPGGAVSVRIIQTGDAPEGCAAFEFRVKDTGVGMSREFMEHLFEPFERERNSTISGIQGTGLGMAITKNIVDMMNGSIQVHSEQGVGSEFTASFTFRLQASPKETPRISEPQSCRAPAAKRHTGRILLAEDNELNQEIAIAILTEAGFTVELAPNGQIAVNMLEASQPGYYQLILMDIQMPVMDGCGASKEIRKLDRPDAKTIPIFACTANTFKEDRDRAMESGMNDFLSKPIDVNILLEKLAFISGRQDSYT